ncbi:MAG: SDR family NAD(P)-dependent oxidoreductase, partial [Alphaproteobacteria bacterium]
MRFQGKVAIVTGASLGIGKATSEALAQEGARVVLASRDPESGQKAATAITDRGGEVVFASTDVSREEECRALIDRAVGLYGRLDILVNNAGVYLQGDAKSTSQADWNRVLAINLTGAFLCTKYAIPAMVRSGGGVIVNVSSEAGLTGIKGQVAYNVSKGGLVALTRSSAVDLAEWGIRVNCVCPGTTDTPLVRE